MKLIAKINIDTASGKRFKVYIPVKPELASCITKCTKTASSIKKMPSNHGVISTTQQEIDSNVLNTPKEFSNTGKESTKTNVAKGISIIFLNNNLDFLYSLDSLILQALILYQL